MDRKPADTIRHGNVPPSHLVTVMDCVGDAGGFSSKETVHEISCCCRLSASVRISDQEQEIDVGAMDGRMRDELNTEPMEVIPLRVKINGHSHGF